MDLLTCSACHNLNGKKQTTDQNALYRRALDGCPGCSLLLAVILRLIDGRPAIQSLTISPAEVDETGLLLLRVNMVNGVERDIEIFRQQTHMGLEEFHQTEGFPESCQRRWWPRIGFARSVSHHSGSAECLTLAKQWLKNCLENHAECPGFGPSDLPTRVLYVGVASKEPRLVITKGTRGSYTTLSHCWGNVMPTRLTAQTINLWQTEIPMEALPQTFRDAVVVTRALGIDYLWIDSLCILQDNPEDWASESSRMADVYANAVVTIAADQSSGCNGGIFAERDKGEVYALPIKLSPCSCNYCTIFARWKRSRSYPFLRHSADHAPQRYGLNSRGWTYQERLLSRRVLHFTPSELAWECTKEASCECRLHGTVPKQYLVFRRAFVSPIEKRKQANKDEITRDALREAHGPLFDEAGGNPSNLAQLQWELVVFEFTARSLTVKTDRLTALAGIASLLCHCTSQEYYFGVLSGHAVRGLLWRYRPNTQETHRKCISRRLPAGFAPSWSFGSIVGRVEFVPKPEKFIQLHPAATIHHISRQLSSANPYGPGTGTIDIEGCMVPVRLEDPKYTAGRREGEVLFVVNGPSLSVKSEDPPHGYPKGLPWGYCQLDTDAYDLEIYGAISTYLLIMGWCGAGRDARTLGLIVTEVTGDSQKVSYRRVGIFSGVGRLVEYKMSRWNRFGETKRIQLV